MLELKRNPGQFGKQEDWAAGLRVQVEVELHHVWRLQKLPLGFPLSCPVLLLRRLLCRLYAETPPLKREALQLLNGGDSSKITGWQGWAGWPVPPTGWSQCFVNSSEIFTSLFSSRLRPRALLIRRLQQQAVKFHTSGSVPVCTTRIRAIHSSPVTPPHALPPIPHYFQWLAKAFTPTEPFHILSLYDHKLIWLDSPLVCNLISGQIQIFWDGVRSLLGENWWAKSIMKSREGVTQASRSTVQSLLQKRRAGHNCSKGGLEHWLWLVLS